MRGFRQHMAISEAHFSPRRQTQLNLQGATRRNYQGWEVWFVDRNDGGDALRQFALWAEENEEELERAVNDAINAQSVGEDLKVNLDKLIKTRELSDVGWSDRILSARGDDQKMLAKLGSILPGEVDEEEWKARKDILGDHYEDANVPQFLDNRFLQTLGQEKDRYEQRETEKKIVSLMRAEARQVFNAVLENHFDAGEIKYLHAYLYDHGGLTYQLSPERISDANLDYHKLVALRKQGVRAVLEAVMDGVREMVTGYLKTLKRVLRSSGPGADAVAVELQEFANDALYSAIVRLYNLWSRDHRELRRAVDFGKYVTTQIKPRTLEDSLERNLYSSNSLHDALFEPVFDAANEFLSRHSDGNHRDFDSYVNDGMAAVAKVINTLTTFGLRNFHKVPIVFSYQNFSEPSGYGAGNFAAGKAYNNHVQVYGQHGEEETIRILSHEIGHIVYDRLPLDQQRRVEEMAKKLGVYPNDYSKPSFQFPGAAAPSVHHQKGNEWFAVMIEFMALHPVGQNWNQVGSNITHQVPTTPDDRKSYQSAVRQVKQVTAGSQNYGPGYKSERPPEKVARPPRRLEPRKVPKPQSGSGI